MDKNVHNFVDKCISVQIVNKFLPKDRQAPNPKPKSRQYQITKQNQTKSNQIKPNAHCQAMMTEQNKTQQNKRSSTYEHSTIWR